MLFRILICTSFFVAYAHKAQAMEQAIPPTIPQDAVKLISLIPLVTQAFDSALQSPATPLAECSDALECFSTYCPQNGYWLAALAYLIPHAHDAINHDDATFKAVMTPFTMKNEFSTIINLHTYQLMSRSPSPLAAIFANMQGIQETINHPNYQGMKLNEIVDLKVSQVMKALPVQGDCAQYLAAVKPPLKQDHIQSILSEHATLAQVLTAAQRLLNAPNTQPKASANTATHCIQQNQSESAQETCRLLIPQVGSLLRMSISEPSKPLDTCSTALECLMAHRHQPDYLLSVLAHFIRTPNDLVIPQMQDALTCIKLTPVLCSLGRLKIISAMLAKMHTDAQPHVELTIPNAFVANEVQEHEDNLASAALKEMQEMKAGLFADQKYLDTLKTIRSQLHAPLVRGIINEYHTLLGTLTKAESLLQAHINSQQSASGAA